MESTFWMLISFILATLVVIQGYMIKDLKRSKAKHRYLFRDAHINPVALKMQKTVRDIRSRSRRMA